MKQKNFYILCLVLIASFSFQIHADEFSFEDIWKKDRQWQIDTTRYEIRRKREIISNHTIGPDIVFDDCSRNWNPFAEWFIYPGLLNDLDSLCKNLTLLTDALPPMPVYAERMIPYIMPLDRISTANQRIHACIESGECAKNKGFWEKHARRGSLLEADIFDRIAPELAKIKGDALTALKQRMFLSVGVSLLPFIGPYKDYEDYKNGKDNFTGIALTDFEMTSQPVFIAMGIFDIGLLTRLKKFRALGTLSDVDRLVDGADDIADLRFLAHELEMGGEAIRSSRLFKTLSRTKELLETAIDTIHRRIYFLKFGTHSAKNALSALRVKKVTERTLVIIPGFGNFRFGSNIIDLLHDRYDRVVLLTLEDGGAPLIRASYTPNKMYLNVGGSGLAHNLDIEKLGKLAAERLAYLRKEGYLAGKFDLLEHSLGAPIGRVARSHLSDIDDGLRAQNVMTVGGAHFAADTIAGQRGFRAILERSVAHVSGGHEAIRSLDATMITDLNRRYPLDLTHLDGRIFLIGSETTESMGRVLKSATRTNDGDGIVTMAAQMARGIHVVGDESRIGRLVFHGPSHWSQIFDARLLDHFFRIMGRLGPSEEIINLSRKKF